MRVKIMLGAALSASLLASSVTQSAQSQAANQLAVSSATTTPASTAVAPAPGAPAPGATSAEPIVWYTDPIALGLVLFAIFAVVDIAILFAKNSHHGNRHLLN